MTQQLATGTGRSTALVLLDLDLDLAERISMVVRA